MESFFTSALERPCCVDAELSTYTADRSSALIKIGTRFFISCKNESYLASTLIGALGINAMLFTLAASVSTFVPVHASFTLDFKALLTTAHSFSTIVPAVMLTTAVSTSTWILS